MCREEVLSQVAGSPLKLLPLRVFVPDCGMKREFVLWQRGKDWPGAAFE